MQSLHHAVGLVVGCIQNTHQVTLIEFLDLVEPKSLFYQPGAWSVLSPSID